MVYAPIVNIPVLFKNARGSLELEIAKGTGEMVALNVGDGSVKWKRDLAQPAYGAATISNDLVFTTTFEGKVIALDRDTGSVVWEKQLPAGTNARGGGPNGSGDRGRGEPGLPRRPEARVAVALLDELVMGSDLDETAELHHRHTVGSLCRRQAGGRS